MRAIITAAPTDLRISLAGPQDDDAVIALWREAGLTRPWNDPARDIAFARSSGHAAILVGHTDGGLVASAMVGHDGHRGVVYYVSVAADCRGRGFGRAIMAAAEAWLREKGVWKLNLLARAGNEAVTDFYGALGFEAQPRVYLEKWLDESLKPTT